MNKHTSFLQFTDAAYSYPSESGSSDVSGSENPPVFEHFTAEFPEGFVCLTGPNGSGKSTFLLLGAARLLPSFGAVSIFDVDTRALTDENAKNSLCSFIYQNMEFETDDRIKPLLEFVYVNGGHTHKDDSFLQEIISIFGLEKLLDKSLTGISKGEIQRVMLAFSLLYGSRSIFMDEPFFAMEEKQKETVLEYLRNYSLGRKVPVYIAMHELELTRKYAETVVLFYPNRRMELGTPEEILTHEALEKAYGVPHAMLRDGEILNTKKLREEWNILHPSV